MRAPVLIREGVLKYCEISAPVLCKMSPTQNYIKIRIRTNGWKTSWGPRIYYCDRWRSIKCLSQMISIGPSTSNALKECGLPLASQAEKPTAESIVQAILSVRNVACWRHDCSTEDAFLPSSFNLRLLNRLPYRFYYATTPIICDSWNLEFFSSQSYTFIFKWMIIINQLMKFSSCSRGFIRRVNDLGSVDARSP